METINETELNKAQEKVQALRQEMAKRVIGQEALVDKLLITLFCRQHILIEGVPGLAKTLAVTTLAKAMDASYQRIQFTPDLLPADLIGTMMYHPGEREFYTKKGPVFTQLLLADEVNRAPAKVQSALLESMQERQVTLGDKTHGLPDPFMVLATQNPVEQEGTYPLPEAQMDRFMMKILVDYPQREEEVQILRQQSSGEELEELSPVLTPEDVRAMGQLADRVFLSPKVEGYMVDLVRCTRNPELCGLEEMKSWIQFGASPRASIFLAKACKALALLQGKDYVTPQMVKDLAPDILRHRILPSYEAEAEGINSDRIIKDICDKLQVP